MTNRDIAEGIAWSIDYDLSAESRRELTDVIERALDANVYADVADMSSFQLVRLFVIITNEMERRTSIALNQVKHDD